MLNNIYIAVIIIFFNIFPAFSEPEFTPLLNKSEIFFNEEVIYSIQIKGENLPDFTIRQIPDFIIVDQKTEYAGNSYFETIIDGKLIQSINSNRAKILYFTLKPLKTGNIKIGPFNALIDSQPYIIPPVKLLVKKKENSFSEKIVSAEYNSGRQVFIETSVSSILKKKQERKENPDFNSFFYINEPIIVEYNLYSKVNIKFLDNPEIPIYKGFQTENDFEFQSSFIKNKDKYKLYSIRRIIYPLIAGELVVPGIKINMLSNYDPYFNTGRNIKIKSEDKKIYVRKIETNDLDFTRIVADSISLSYFFDTDKILVHQPFTLILKLDGRFNLRVPVPMKLKLSDGLRVFNQTDSNSISCDSYGLYGSKIYKYILISENSGTETASISSISFYSDKSKKIEKLDCQIVIYVDSDQINLPGADKSNFISYYSYHKKKSAPMYKKNSDIIDKLFVFFIVILSSITLIFFINKKKCNKMAINKKTVFDKFDLKNISETIEPKIFYERIYDSLVYIYLLNLKSILQLILIN
ncbi:BatD family protein [Candidatus Dependentiae bacterium]|nr:BatD family protein [Candidatus Dependentiae bacterium]